MDADTLASLATPALMASRLGTSQRCRENKAHLPGCNCWKPARHLIEIDKVLTRAIAGFGPRIIVVQCPPRHGKSEYHSKWLPTNFAARFPDRRTILTSYESNFAASWGRKVRNNIDEHEATLGIKVSSSKSAANDWDIEGHAGGLITAGAGGALTGRGADLMILDDLIKNHDEALSEGVRDSRWEWWQSTASTRIEPGGLAVFVGTRWHEDDPQGRIIKQAMEGGDPITLIHLPALAEENDWLGRRKGQALWPERWSRAELLKRKRAIDRYWWLSLYQQLPGRHGSSEWPEDYFADHIWVDYLPERFEIGAIAVDPSKGKDARKGDFSAIVYVGVYNGCLYVDSTVRRRPSEEIIRDGINHAVKFGRAGLQGFGVETNQFQELLLPEFARELQNRKLPPLPFFELVNTVNKKLRISRLGPYFNRRKIRFLDTPDNRLLIQQCKSFTMKDRAGVHDDGPDALEMAIRTLIESVLGGNVRDDGLGDSLVKEA